jgi:hypothetical protein
MANVPVNISRTIVQRPNGSASNAPVFDFPVDPLNPPGGGGAGSQIPPVHLAYSSEANMIAGQANQIANFIYFDGTKYWEYLGTTNGTIVDYRAWSGGDIVQPNGLTQIGTFVQTGNDIDVNPDWIWRFNQVLYQKTTITPFTIAPAAVGFTRIDLIYGNTSTQVLLVSGTEVEDPTPAVPPSVPANSVGFFLVFVDDSGITAFQNFALSSFVRFDVNNQNLSAIQRQNARTNIQALSRDTNDSRTGTLTQNGSLVLNGGFSWTHNQNNNTITGSGGLNDVNPFLRFFINDSNANRSAISLGTPTQRRVVIRYSGMYAMWDDSNNVILILRSNGRIFHARSVDAEESIRRDELPFNYPQTVATTGTINDLSLTNEGVKLLILSGASTPELTGVNPVTTNTARLLRITSTNAGGALLKHEDAGSTAANRFALPGAADITINQNEIYTFIYTNGRWRRVL